jgi:hypothetical protein
MSVKPSDNEEEYFARLEMERRRAAAKEHDARMQAAERERLKALHHMKCPKCGSDLEEIEFGTIRVDKCFHCEGLWLDKGELEAIQNKDAGFARRLLGLFRS